MAMSYKAESWVEVYGIHSLDLNIYYYIMHSAQNRQKCHGAGLTTQQTQAANVIIHQPWFK